MKLLLLVHIDIGTVLYRMSTVLTLKYSEQHIHRGNSVIANKTHGIMDFESGATEQLLHVQDVTT